MVATRLFKMKDLKSRYWTLCVQLQNVLYETSIHTSIDRGDIHMTTFSGQRPGQPGYFIVATPNAPGSGMHGRAACRRRGWTPLQGRPRVQAPAAGMRWVSSVFARYKMDFAMMDDISSETGRKNTATVKYPGQPC
jgi:hypothetical protein